MLAPVVRLGWDTNNALVVSAREIRASLGIRSTGQRDFFKHWFERVISNLNLIEGQDFRYIGTDYLVLLKVAQKITADSGIENASNDNCLDLQEIAEKKWQEFRELLISYRCWEMPEVFIGKERFSLRGKSKQGEYQLVIPGNTEVIRTLMGGVPLAHIARIWQKDGLIKHLIGRRIVEKYDTRMVNSLVIMRKQWQQDK